MLQHHPFEPVTSTRIREQLRENFSQGFLTLISIVLGVALATLAQRLYEIRPLWSYVVAIQASTVFLSISGTFYYYNYFISVITLPPNFMQVMIPFFLGSGIIAVSYTVGHNDAFWVANAVLYLIAAVTFLNTLILNRRSLYEPSAIAAYTLIRNEELKNVGCFIIMAAGTAAFLFFAPSSIIDYKDIILFLWDGAVYMLCVILTEIRFLRGIFKIVANDKLQPVFPIR